MVISERVRKVLGPRVLAFAADYLVIAAYLVLLVAAGATLRATAPTVIATLFGNPFSAQAVGFLLITLPVALYFGLLEASPWQASWGKRRLRLRVTREDGSRLSHARSLSRTALKFIPWELAHTCIWQISLRPAEASAFFLTGITLVWVLVAVNLASLLIDPHGRTLYDRLAGTVVVRYDSGAPAVTGRPASIVQGPRP